MDSKILSFLSIVCLSKCQAKEKNLLYFEHKQHNIEDKRMNFLLVFKLTVDYVQYGGKQRYRVSFFVSNIEEPIRIGQ
jgi:hypothetical protein